MKIKGYCLMQLFPHQQKALEENFTRLLKSRHPIQSGSAECVNTDLPKIRTLYWLDKIVRPIIRRTPQQLLTTTSLPLIWQKNSAWYSVPKSEESADSILSKLKSSGTARKKKLLKTLNVQTIAMIAVCRFSAAVEICRTFKPDAALRTVINSERALLKNSK